MADATDPRGLPPNALAVRDDDAFDVPAVDAWLKERVGGLTGTPSITQFAGGASNLTYLLRYPGARSGPAAPTGWHESQLSTRHGA